MALSVFISSSQLKWILSNTHEEIDYVSQLMHAYTVIDMYKFASTCLIIIFIIANLYKRIYNDDGTMYSILQLPVNRGYQIISMLIEVILFVSIQYILVYIAPTIFFRYANSLLNSPEFIRFASLLEALPKAKITMMQDSGIRLFSLNKENIFYRLFITWPTITACITLLFFGVYKYKIKILIAFVVMLILSMFVVSSGNIIFDIIQFILTNFFLIIFEVFDTNTLIQSILILVMVTLVNIYIYRNKLDF
ncbi:MAG: hypothetical protein RR972_02760 [Peptostreptococcus sp.]